MKFITREVTLNQYTFANIDLETGNAYNMEIISSVDTMGVREQRKYSKEHNNAILIDVSYRTVKYSLPLEDFIKACEEYATRVADGTAHEITEDDEIDTATI